MTKLTTAQTITQVVTDVEITAMIHNFESGTLEAHYITKLADGTPYQRGNIQLTEEVDIAALYDAIDTAIEAGTTARSAIDTIVTAKVIEAVEG